MEPRSLCLDCYLWYRGRGMCFPSILWLMAIHCLSAFFFSSDYLCFCREKDFLSSTSFSLVYSPISPLLIFHIFLVLCPLFLNQPPPGLRASSCTGRDSTHVVLYKWKIWRSREKWRCICRVPCFPLPSRMGGWKGWHLHLSICASFFRETGAE